MLKNLKMVLVLASLTVAVPVVAQRKPTPVSIKVEAEGGGKNQGMWVQEAIDVSPQELKTIQSLITADIKNQGDVNIVPLTYPEDCIAIAVVVAKVPRRAGGTVYIASSAILLATKKGVDEFGGHNVLAESNPEQLAHAIGFQFASLRLQIALGTFLK